jgi:hypothetical protein
VPKGESARLGGKKQVYMAIIQGQTVQTGYQTCVHIMRSHRGASKKGIDFIGFYWGSPGSPSPPFKVGTLDQLLLALDDVGVPAMEVVDPVAGLADRDVVDVAVVCLGPEEARPDVLLNVMDDPHGLLEGEQAVAGGEDSSDLGDVGEIADGGGLGVSVIVVPVGGEGDEVSGVIDPGVFGGTGTGAAGASADSGGVRDHAVPPQLVGAPGANGVVREGVFKLVPVAVPPRGREGGGRAGEVVVAEGGLAVGVDIEGLVGARAGVSWEGVLAHPGVLDVRAWGPGGGGVRVARGPGGGGVGVVEHPLEVVEVGHTEGEGAGGGGQHGERERGGGWEVDGGRHGWG